jgi:hypothetical protein
MLARTTHNTKGITEMQWDAMGIMAGTAGLLVGQVVDITAPSGWGALMQGGALLVLSIAFLHTLVKTLPKKDADHNEAVKILVTRQNEVVDKLADRQTEALDRLGEAINRLRVHCAAVNPGRSRD